MHREPDVPEAVVPVEECLDGHARITSKELATKHSVKNSILQNACSTSPRVIADLVKSVLMRIARLTTSLAKGLKRMVTRVQWLCSKGMRSLKEQGDLFWTLTHQVHDNWVAYSRIWSRRSLLSILRKSSNIRKPIRCVKFTKAVVRHADIRDQNPVLGMICPGDPHRRNSNAPKFEDRSQEETEWQERCAREAAWRLAESIPKLKEKIKQHSSHLRKTGACLRHQILNLRNENLLSPPERRCTDQQKVL